MISFSKCVTLEGVIHQCLIIMLNIPLMVTIHERENIIVWVVVHTKIPVVQVFEHQPKALELAETLRLIDKHKFGNKTYTLLVERFVNPLEGDE